MNDSNNDDFDLAAKFGAIEEKHRVKRTNDFLEAINQLQEQQQIIQEALDALTSGEPVPEQIADNMVNYGVSMQGISKLIRPHTPERLWKFRHDKAQKKIAPRRRRDVGAVLARHRGKSSQSALPAASAVPAFAFEKYFTTVSQKYSWGGNESVPSEQWFRFVKENYYGTGPEE